MKFCVSLTTIPSRIKNVYKTIENLNNQTIKPDKIFLNIPNEYKRFKNEKISENDINDLKNLNVEITRCEDFGPATKLMGSLEKVKDYNCVILIDDDHLYYKNIFQIFIEEFKKNSINYSFYLNKILNIKMGQCCDGFLINTKLLDKIDIFYEKFVKNNKNMFLDDDLWFAIYLQNVKKSKIENLIEKFRSVSKDEGVPLDNKGRKIVYSQHSNSTIDSLHLNEHKKRFLIYNRRKIQKIEYIKFIMKSLFVKL
jgi:hypothetical protein|tara:strand:- start:2432 stop:3193 length:762 start_codon:yes stop_codon:yes gene_type:complete